MEYESTILKRLIDTYGVVGNPRYISEIIKEFIVRGKECFPNLFTYQSDWLAHIDEYGINPSYTVSYTGQSFYAPNTLEKPIKSAILKGNTEVIVVGKNLFNGNLENGAYSQFTGVKEEAADSLRSVDFIKVEPSSTICCSNNGIARATHIFEYDENKKFLKFNNAVTKLILSSSTKYVTFYGGNSDRDKMQIEYGEEPTYYEEYKQTLTSVRMPVLKTVGKNLFNRNGKLFDGWLHNGGSFVEVIGGGLWTTDFIETKNESYISFSGINSDFINFAFFDGDYNIVGSRINNVYTVQIPMNAKYIRITFNKSDTDTFQIEYGNKSTSYEPYKSNILTVNEDVELGSVGEVKDELNLLTGQLTQRTETRAYQEGDESNSEVLTDMTNTRYKLPTESIKTVDLTIKDQDNQVINQLTTFEGGTHFTTSSQEGSLLPTISVDVVTDLEETLSLCSTDGNTM